MAGDYHPNLVWFFGADGQTFNYPATKVEEIARLLMDGNGKDSMDKDPLEVMRRLEWSGRAHNPGVRGLWLADSYRRCCPECHGIDPSELRFNEVEKGHKITCELGSLLAGQEEMERRQEAISAIKELNEKVTESKSRIDVWERYVREENVKVREWQASIRDIEREGVEPEPPDYSPYDL